MPMSTHAADAILDAIFQKTSPAWGALATPPTVYCALIKTALVVSDSGATLDSKEADYTAYARKLTAAGDWAEPSGGAIQNANDLVFPQATGGSSLCIQAALIDAATGGNLIAWGLLAPSALKEFVYETEDAEFVVGGHGWANDTELRLLKKDTTPGLPTGVDENSKYFLINSTSDSFDLSTSQGGAAVSVTTDGEGYVGVDGALNVTNNVTPKIEATNLTLTVV